MIRVATCEDIPAMLNVIKKMGSGMGSSLKVDLKKLEAKLEQDIWFVLTVQGEVVGICGLSIAPDGVWAYRMNDSLLIKERCFVGAVQLCSQYLLPRFRGTSLGGKLTIGPLKYIDDHPENFPSVAFGELRGVYREDSTCPFWSAIPWPFACYEDYAQALNGGHEEELIANLPDVIELAQIPTEALAVVQKCHPETQANQRIVERFGFRVSEFVSYSTAAPLMIKNIQPEEAKQCAA